MIRFDYKVIKPFSIYKDEDGSKRIARTEEEKKVGACFELPIRYVDYESKKDDFEQDTLTLELCRLGYLKLLRKVEMPNTK